MDTFWDVLLYFYLFGFCGWVCECVFCSLNEKKLVNRGFVSGPICPIYSFGGLVVVYILAPVRNHIVLLFLLGMICATIIEYVSSYLLEKLFQTSWWDYSDLPFNINGRVCLRFSLMFGVLSVIAVRLLYQPFSYIIGMLPVLVKPWLAVGLSAIFLCDCAVTVHSILRLNGKLQELHTLSAELREKLESLQGGRRTLAERLEQFKAERLTTEPHIRNPLDNLIERMEKYRSNITGGWQHRRLMNAFPRMRSVRHQEQFQEVKAAFQALIEKRRKKD